MLCQLQSIENCPVVYVEMILRTPRRYFAVLNIIRSSSRGVHLIHSTQHCGVQVSCVAPSPSDIRNAILTPTLEDIDMAQSYYQHSSSARQTFLAGRCALRHAVTTVHNIELPCIPRNHYGVPIVPVPASLSHKNDLAVGAALISSDNFTNTTVGVDIEVVSRPYSSKQLNSFQSHILTSEERRALSSANALSTSLLIFSIKEAVYKALFPHYQRYIGFKEVVVVLSDQSANCGSAEVRFLSENKIYFRGVCEVHWQKFMTDYWISVVKYVL